MFESMMQLYWHRFVTKRRCGDALCNVLLCRKCLCYRPCFL